MTKPEKLSRVVARAARAHVREALKFTGGDKREAARLLGVSLATLYRTLRWVGLYDDFVKVSGRFGRRPVVGVEVEEGLEENECRALIRRAGEKSKPPKALGEDVHALLYYFVGQKFKTRGKSFWLDHRHELEELLHDARVGYIERVKRCHPDLHPEANGEIAQVTRAWKVLRGLFKKHGVE